MEEPVRQADGAVVIEGCHKPPETIRTLSARVAPRVLDERAEPPDLLVASYGQVDDDSKPACTDHLFVRQGSHGFSL